MDCCHVFIDESGDFGFSEKSAKYLILAAILTENPEAIERIPRHVRKKFLKKLAKQRRSELKFQSSNHRIRMYFLKMIARLYSARIGFIILDKAHIDDFHAKHRDLIYRKMCIDLIRGLIQRERIRKKFVIIFDYMPMHVKNRLQFINEIHASIEREFQRLRMIPPKIIVSTESSEKNNGLKVADFIAGAIRMKYAKCQPEYFDIIKHLIDFKKEW